MSRITFVFGSDAVFRESRELQLQSFGFDVSWCANMDGSESEIVSSTVDCVLVDIKSKSGSGLALVEHLGGTIDASPPVIALCDRGNVRIAVRAVQYGAFDSVELPGDSEFLVGRIRMAVAFRHRIAAREKDRERVLRCLNSLTDTERRILDFVVMGHSTKEIAAELRRSRRTVENHRAHILQKMHAKNVAELVRSCFLNNVPLHLRSVRLEAAFVEKDGAN